MKRIGIISLFDFGNINYGNKLQTYALNFYLRKKYPNDVIESLYFNKFLESNDKNIWAFFKSKIRRIPGKVNSIISIKTILKKRLNRCNKFSIENTNLCKEAFTWDKLINSSYDALIVGSDIVWGQYRNGISKIKFLDFETAGRLYKISYAASFGRDWIPKENVNDIVRCLKKFNNISVREDSSVSMLKNIGIENVVHTLDPTLLLTPNDWEKTERKPNISVDKFIFVYLLGQSKNDRDKIKLLAEEENIKIVTIPYACGEYSKADVGFGDIRLMDCSPEEWIWLIHNAEYVITDSFHGTVFSTIFQKKFIVVEREFTENINNRMIDYLKTIEESDKMVKLSQIKSFENFVWDYEKINSLLENKRKFSEDYLKNALEQIM